MNIYTSYYGNHKVLTQNNIIIIGISIGQPKGLNVPMIKELAPDYSFLNKPYEDYKKEYIKKLNGLNWQIVRNKIDEISKGKDVALCCFESLKKENDWCHRTMLATYVKETFQYIIPEYEEVKNQLSLF